MCAWRQRSGVSEATQARAAAIAAQRGSSIGDVVDEALDVYEKAEFWRLTRLALGKHPVELEEDHTWDRAIGDGLERD